MLNVLRMIHFLLVYKELFGDAVGLHSVHEQDFLLLVQGVEADTRFFIDINSKSLRI